MQEQKGSCWCGNVRMAFSTEPVSVGNCHCKDCRKAVGASFVTWLALALEELTLSGSVKKICRNAGKERWFCSQCGSSIAFNPEGSGVIAINAMLLDNAEAFPPQFDVWLQEKPSWCANSAQYA